jgi:hypothetical protein
VESEEKQSFGIINFPDPNHEEAPISYCPECQANDVQSILKPRILMPGETKPRDYDLWRQCWICGLIVPRYELKKESKIKDIVEVSDNPWDQGKSAPGLGNKRKRKQNEMQRLKDRIEQEKDLDVKQELKKGNIVEIIESATSAEERTSF